MARLIFTLLLFGLAIFIFVQLRTIFPGRGPRGQRKGPRRVDVVVQDPVCNVFLPRNRAIEARIGGETRYFCSEACAQEYRKKIAAG